MKKSNAEEGVAILETSPRGQRGKPEGRDLAPAGLMTSNATPDGDSALRCSSALSRGNALPAGSGFLGLGRCEGGDGAAKEGTALQRRGRRCKGGDAANHQGRSVVLSAKTETNEDRSYHL
eukprot:scaffold1307_cov200-Pinguiococcus_pyrenoidosus.AAC.29